MTEEGVASKGTAAGRAAGGAAAYEEGERTKRGVASEGTAAGKAAGGAAGAWFIKLGSGRTGGIKGPPWPSIPWAPPPGRGGGGLQGPLQPRGLRRMGWFGKPLQLGVGSRHTSLRSRSAKGRGG